MGVPCGAAPLGSTSGLLPTFLTFLPEKLGLHALKSCGIVLDRTFQLLKLVDQGPDEVAHLCGSPELPQADGLDKRTFCDEHVVVWTDAASCNNRDSRMRRAGCCVFFGVGNVLKFNLQSPRKRAK